MAEFITVEDINKLLGTKTQRTRQIIKKADKLKRFRIPVKSKGLRKLYDAKAANELVRLYRSGALGRVRSRVSTAAPKGAKPVVSKGLAVAPVQGHALTFRGVIDDSKVAKTLLKKFGNVQALEEHVVAYLHDHAKPLVAQLTKIESEYEDKLKRLFGTGSKARGRK